MKKTSLLFFIALGLFVAAPVFANTQSFSRNLYYGLTNDSGVQALQQFLTAQGDYTGPVTGNFFTLTQQAVKKFQQNNNISPVSGYFGPLTRTAVNNMLSQQSSVSTQQQSSTGSQTLGGASTNSATSFQTKAQCATLGQQKENADNASNKGTSLSLFKDLYGYSPSLNTCLYAAEYISTDWSDRSKDLIGGTFFDLLTGSKVSEPGAFFELMSTTALPADEFIYNGYVYSCTNPTYTSTNNQTGQSQWTQIQSSCGSTWIYTPSLTPTAAIASSNSVPLDFVSKSQIFWTEYGILVP